MRAAVLLVGISLAAVAGAQVRTNPQKTSLPPAGSFRVEDAQIALLKKQMAEIKQQVLELQEKNGVLSHCLHELRDDVKRLKNPQLAQLDDEVTVGKPMSLVKCD
ncbi:hypothetical protein [Lysobacter tyrosinilyticus]